MGSQRNANQGLMPAYTQNFTCASPILRLFTHCFASLRNVVLHADGESKMADPLTQPKRNLTFTNMAGRIILYLHGGFAPHYHSCSEGLCACTLPKCYFCIYLASGPVLQVYLNTQRIYVAHPLFLSGTRVFTGLIVWTGLRDLLYGTERISRFRDIYINRTCRG
jgi:hypothetical protein